MPSLVVISDDAASLARLRVAVRRAAALRVDATLDGRRPVRQHLSTLAPDLVLVDHMCQRLNSLARLREAAEHAPGATRLLLAERRDDASVEDAFEAGAHAVVDRNMHPSALGALLAELAGGRIMLTSGRPAAAAPIHPEGQRAPVAHLRAVGQQVRGTRASA